MWGGETAQLCSIVIFGHNERRKRLQMQSTWEWRQKLRSCCCSFRVRGRGRGGKQECLRGSVMVTSSPFPRWSLRVTVRKIHLHVPKRWFFTVITVFISSNRGYPGLASSADCILMINVNRLRYIDAPPPQNGSHRLLISTLGWIVSKWRCTVCANAGITHTQLTKWVFKYSNSFFLII